MTDTCTCGGSFRTAEDYRDHLPCHGTKDQRTIKELRERISELEAEISRQRDEQLGPHGVR